MDFLTGLDTFFCEEYANYDMFCGLPQYEMPTMYRTEKDDFGDVTSYSLPKTEMRLSKQRNKDELLAAVKAKLVSQDFTFSFSTVKWYAVLKHRFSKKGFVYVATEFAKRHNLTFEQLFEETTVDKEIIEGIKKGSYLPTKNLLFAIALSAHLTLDETEMLMYVCEKEWDNEQHRDVVVRYLLTKSVFNADLVWSALDEYKVENLYLKRKTA